MILSPRLAIVSLGVSCQTAHQIEAHAAFVGERLGCAMEKRTTPFDWLYVPVSGAAAMLRDECYFPATVGELEMPKLVSWNVVEQGWKKPYWPKYGVTFWHSKFQEPSTFESKSRHAADNFKRLCQADRRVFIVSNTQNNIARSMRDAGREPMDAVVDYAGAVALYRSLAEQFWPCELHAVSHADIYASKRQPESDGIWRLSRFHVHRFTPDRSTWEGDGKQWRKLFEEIVT